MIPILYESNEINFESNGLGRLRDCISCKVTEERNGVYECDFEYPVTGAGFEKIKEGRIIGVTHEESDDVQPFDIISSTRPIDGVVSFHAVHISYRQTKMVSWGTEINSLEAAFYCFDTQFYPDNPLGQDAGGNPFTYLTDKDSTGFVSAFDGKPRSIRSLLGGVEGSILDAYGGEYEWDKWFVRLHSARGTVRDFTIRYGVNMLKYENETDYSDSFNTCIPYYVDSESNTILIGDEIKAGFPTTGVGDKCIALDLTEKFEARPTKAQLETVASNYMLANKTFNPAQTINVDFIRLQDEAGFDEFDDLLKCKLCDSIRVIFPMYDASAYYKIVKTVWDVLQDRYETMELGTLSTTLSEALGVGSGGGGSVGGGAPTTVSVKVNSTTTGAPGTNASVTNVGDPVNVELDFVIPRGDKGDTGDTGPTGAAAGFGTPTASIDANVGTPSVTVSASGPDTAKNFDFAFHNLKGQKGDKGDTGNTGAAAGFGTPTASVDANVGTPSVTVSASGADTAKVFNFAFKNLKGQKGDAGVVEAYPRTGVTPLSRNWLSETQGGSALTPEAERIYILMADSGDYVANTMLRWNGSAYELLSSAGSGGGGEHVELTQAQYDALSQAEKENGSVYFITDASPAMSSLLDMFYPVGSYYETSNSSFNPNTAWGGTWVKDTAGRVTVGYDSSQTEFNSLGKTGGAKTHQHLVGESITNSNQIAGAAVVSLSNYTSTASSLQPYIVVNRWHRTA